MSKGSRKKRATRPWQDANALRDIEDLLGRQENRAPEEPSEGRRGWSSEEPSEGRWGWSSEDEDELRSRWDVDDDPQESAARESAPRESAPRESASDRRGSSQA